MIRRPPRSTQSRSSAASDVYKRQQSALPNSADSRRSRRNLSCSRHKAAGISSSNERGAGGIGNHSRPPAWYGAGKRCGFPHHRRVLPFATVGQEERLGKLSFHCALAGGSAAILAVLSTGIRLGRRLAGLVVA